jgi:transposase
MQGKKRVNPPAGGGSNTYRTQIDQGSHSLISEPGNGEMTADMSRAAKQRLKWMKHLSKYRNARLTCRHFGISPDTFYLWKKRFVSGNLKSLEDDFKTRKPHKLRVSKHKIAQLETIKRLKNSNPRLGKTRIAKILKETGYRISSSTVSRILKDREGLTFKSKEP